MKKISKLLLALSFVLSITSSAFAVTVASWGGAYTESQKLGYGDPTAKKLGINYVLLTSEGNNRNEEIQLSQNDKINV